MEPCKTCAGDGDNEDCPECSGSGITIDPDLDEDGENITHSYHFGSFCEDDDDELDPDDEFEEDCASVRRFEQGCYEEDDIPEDDEEDW